MSLITNIDLMFVKKKIKKKFQKNYFKSIEKDLIFR